MPPARKGEDGSVVALETAAVSSKLNEEIREMLSMVEADG